MRRLIPVLLVLVLALGGCDDSSDPGEGSAEATATTAQDAAPAPKSKKLRPEFEPLTRRQIARVVNSSFRYESDPILDSNGNAPPRTDAEPVIVAIRTSKRNPRYAAAVVELRDPNGALLPGTTIYLLRKQHPIGQTGTDFPVPCTDGTPKGLREIICPDLWRSLGHPRPDVRLDRTVRAPEPVTDIRDVDWRNSTMPGLACRSERPLRFRNGGASIRMADHPWMSAPTAGTGWGKNTITYGDLEGDGRDEASVAVSCTNGGGTAAGQVGSSRVVVGQDGSELRLIGVITPRQPMGGIGVHVPLVQVLPGGIKRGRVIAHEGWYGSWDGTCCPSGDVVTVWNYEDGRLMPGKSTIINRPVERP